MTMVGTIIGITYALCTKRPQPPSPSRYTRKVTGTTRAKVTPNPHARKIRTVTHDLQNSGSLRIWT